MGLKLLPLTLCLVAATAWGQDSGEDDPMMDDLPEAADAPAPASDPGDGTGDAAAPAGDDEVAPMAPAEPPAPVADPAPMSDDDVDDDWEEPAPAPTTLMVAVEEEEPEPEVKELDVRKRVLPDYPDELEVMYGQQAIRCEATVWVDAKGHPERIAMTDCPDGFHLAALEAMWKWTWAAPKGYVPAEGVKTMAKTGFVRHDRRYFPGVTYFRSPEEVTADPDLLVTLKGGKMPKYPRAVNAGDDVCLVELVVDDHGNTKSPVVDECSDPYRREMLKVVKSWKWTWSRAPEKKEEHTVITEVVFRL